LRSRLRRSVPGFFARALASALLLNLAVGAASETPTRDEAEALLESYFTALKTGDVATLGELLGGSLRDSRRGLLENPDYGSHLVADYADTDFDVIDYQVLESGDVVATVDTWLTPSERVRYRLTLQHSAATGLLHIVHADVVP
jgi:hypothetical protein